MAGRGREGSSEERCKGHREGDEGERGGEIDDDGERESGRENESGEKEVEGGYRCLFFVGSSSYN